MSPWQECIGGIPPATREDMEGWITGETWIAQRGADLGERMAAAFEDAFGRGVQRAALIGSDVPAPSRHHVREAFDALGTHDVVLGPARDGGYYLVGLPRGFDRGRRTQAFLGSPLGGGGALAHARRALGRVELLQPWADVDTAADLEELSAQLKGDSSQAPAVATWLDQYRGQRVG